MLNRRCGGTDLMKRKPPGWPDYIEAKRSAGGLRYCWNDGRAPPPIGMPDLGRQVFDRRAPDSAMDVRSKQAEVA
jgi:hypothetical protein